MLGVFNFSINFKTVIDKHEGLLEYIKHISSLEDELTTSPIFFYDMKKADSNKKLGQLSLLGKTLIKKTDETMQYIRSKRPAEVYEGLTNLITDLMQFDNDMFNDNNELIIHFRSVVDLHTDAYSERHHIDVYKMIKKCNEIVLILDKLLSNVDFVIQDWNRIEIFIPENYTIFSIFSNRKNYDLSEYLKIIKNLNELYSLICMMLKIDAEKNKLLIKKIETGSFFSQLFGETEVIKSIKEILIGLGTFIRDLVTGKIKKEKFENRCSEISSYMDLVEKAKKNTCDPTIEKALNKKLLDLIEPISEDSTELYIDNIEIIGLAQTEQKEIEDQIKDKLLIENHNNSSKE